MENRLAFPEGPTDRSGGVCVIMNVWIHEVGGRSEGGAIGNDVAPLSKRSSSTGGCRAGVPSSRFQRKKGPGAKGKSSHRQVIR